MFILNQKTHICTSLMTTGPVPRSKLGVPRGGHGGGNGSVSFAEVSCHAAADETLNKTLDAGQKKYEDLLDSSRQSCGSGSGQNRLVWP